MGRGRTRGRRRRGPIRHSTAYKIQEPAFYDRRLPSPFDDLPDELLAAVFARLPCLDQIRSAFMVCRRWHAVAQDESAMGVSRCIGPHTRPTDVSLIDGEVYFVTLSRGDVSRIVLVAAAKADHTQCLRGLRARGHQWHADVCAEAARAGHLACLDYAYGDGCAWDGATTAGAARGGHLDCLRFAVENGCAVGDRVCTEAAARGHLDCLVYAHGKGVKWTDDACIVAIMNANIECLDYLVDNGCPFGLHAYLTAIRQKNPDLVSWVGRRFRK